VAGLLDDRVQAGHVGSEGLQVQGAGHVEHRHQAVRVGEGHAGPGGGERVAADQGEALVQQRDDHLGQFGADPGHALGVAVGQAHHGAAHHVGPGRVALGDAVAEHQPLAEPLPLRRADLRSATPVVRP
jgi:hypothetical protein